MVHIRVENLGLQYPLQKRKTLLGRMSPIAGQNSLAGRNGKTVNRVTAIDGISFSLSAGDRLAVIGANGAGKTTLLKVLYGIFEPTSGSVEIQGRVDALFNINLGFRREATGRRNIELRGLINGWSKAEIDERMDEIIAFSELGEFIDMPFKLYSQGMGARLAFATATSFRPEILLMDEWIGAGDLNFQKKAKERMQTMVEAAGIIVLASHNPAILRATCSHGLVMERGKALFFGPLEDALAHYEKHSEKADRQSR
ncbi:lipopolysaccharide transport system ATP-binding protein [Mesorhizobium sp. J18]|uniref:ABC transporter ATP-binding protein n=1 Tax=Mesorhizobium sp. J18 TaxID=935263 RepID=UPI001199C175|nr:ABC transporter ATP-binding protein [Mesorhizobium sp. J18]TWG91591.1 lipopolysaccharide transport system ATP-binding protein [Mesorhizobium sp. J18]